jgi:hypothetical protein
MEQRLRCAAMFVLSGVAAGIATQEFWVGVAVMTGLAAICMAVLK